MRIYQLIGITVVVALLVLIPILIPPAQADDQMKGQGTVSQEGKGKAPATEEPSELKLGTSSRSELGKETERPMRVPETKGETSHLENLNVESQRFDPETLEHIRIQNEISSVSF